VSGIYLKSCFGSTLEHLVCFPNPIRTSLIGQTNDKLSIPKELWRMVDYIFKRGMDQKNLFMTDGVEQEISQIRELLDIGKSFDEFTGSMHSMAHCLIRFLRSLSEPVIPVQLYRQALESSKSYNQCKQLLSVLPVVHYNVFYYIMAFLREVLLHTSKNKTTAFHLGYVFGDVLIRTSFEQEENEVVLRKKAEFVGHFLNSRVKLKVP